MPMKLDVTVPTSLKDIKLRDYQKFIKIASDKEIGDVFMRQKMVQIFCNIPLLAVNRMSRNDFMMISNQIIQILQERPKLIKTVSLNGEEYGFIPNLQRDLSVGEFVDLDGYMNNWDNFDKAMSVLYRSISLKKGDSYTIVPYMSKSEVSTSKEIDPKEKIILLEAIEKRENDMPLMNMEVVMGAVLFFWTLSSQLLEITPKYLQQVLDKNPKAGEVLEKNGVGISTFINSLGETCLKLERLLPYTLGLRSYS